MPEYPAPLQARLSRSERRRRLMEELLGQTLQPEQTQVVSGRAVPYSPLQGIMKVAQAYLARKGIEGADAEQQAAVDEFERKRQEEQKAIMEMLLGKKAQEAQPQSGGPLRPQDQSAPPYRNAEPFNPNPPAGTYGGQIAQNAMRPMNMGYQQFQPAVPAQPAVEPDYLKAAITAGSSPYVQGTGMEKVAQAMLRNQSQPRGEYNVIRDITVDGKTVPVIFNTRTRETFNMDGTPFRGGAPEGGPTSPAYSPEVKESLAKGAETGKLTAQQALKPSVESAVQAAKSEQKRQFNMSGINEALDRAEGLLKGDIKPTSSFVGAAQDFLGRAVGFSPEGADQAAQLKAIGGALTAKMPRMEGPQSDKDTQLYREMAGQVGDNTLPISTRVAALQEVKRIWAKYEGLNTGQTAEKPAFSDPEKQKRYEEWKARQKK